MKITFQLLTLAFALSSYGSYPVVLYQHTGNAAPTTEGWAASVSGGTTVGPVTDGSTPAWAVNNNTPGDTGFYTAVPTAAEKLAAATLGWSLQTTLRVTSPSEAPGGSMMSLYRDGTRSYQMHFGSAANGDAIVVLFDFSGGLDGTVGTRFTVPGGSVFNTFDLRYSPITSSADLYVNGVVELTGYTGFALSQTLLGWGDGSTIPLFPSNTSAGNYYENIFSIVPEPSAASLFMTGSVALFGSQRFFRRPQIT